LKLGILNADELSPEIVSTYGDYSDMFIQLFKKIDSSFTFSSYQVTQQRYPENIDECDAYLITGSKASAYEDEAWIARLKKYIRQLYAQRKKLVGICFGHQIIAEALGGRVEKSQKGWGVGLIHSEVLQKSNWINPELDDFSLLVSHQDQVTELPDQAVSIASSDFCEHSGFSIDNCILTYQGHPEFSTDYLLSIMNKRRKSIGEPTYHVALASLEQSSDDLTIARWISGFITDP